MDKHVFSRQQAERAGYTQINNSVLLCPFLSDAALRTYSQLRVLDFQGRNGKVWYSAESLEQLLRVPYSSIQWHLRELKHFGLLRQVRRGTQTNEWYWEYPEILVEYAAFYLDMLGEPGGVRNWPWFRDRFLQHLMTHKLELLGEWDRYQRLAGQWKEIRQTRQARSKRKNA